MYGAPLKSLRVSRKDFFSTHRKSLFCPCVSAPFFLGAQKHLWECTSRAPIYIFNIFLQRSFFKRVVVLMRRAKSRRLGERPEQSRAMGRANKEELFRRKEKSTRRISIPFFLLLFFVFGCCGCVDFFHFFLGGRSS